MTAETLDQLSRLLPEVAISVIFATVLIVYMKMSGKSHEEKTVHFTETLKQIEEQHATVMQKIGQTVDANTRAVELNTQVTRDSSKQHSDMLTQLLLKR